MRIVFKEISVKTTKKQKNENNKHRSKTKKFHQTVSPFNLNKDGAPKTEKEIYKEIVEKRDEWLSIINET